MSAKLRRLGTNLGKFPIAASRILKVPQVKICSGYVLHEPPNNGTRLKLAVRGPVFETEKKVFQYRLVVCKSMTIQTVAVSPIQ